MRLISQQRQVAVVDWDPSLASHEGLRCCSDQFHDQVTHLMDSHGRWLQQQQARA